MQMTTIAYKDGVLASDSRATEGMTIISSNCKKVFRLSNGALYGGAGDCDDRDVLDLLAKSSPKKMPTRRELRDLLAEVSGILVFPNGQVFEITVEHDNGVWGAEVLEVVERVVAVGSGKRPALTAMKLGLTAVQAVKHAITEDTGSGGAIQVLRINEKASRAKANGGRAKK
jgi:20S proteasome alpha/beta subunit